MATAELDKEIYDSSTLSKSFSTTPHFEMGIQLGTDDLLDDFPSLPSPASAWKTQQPENWIALLGNPHQSNDDRSLINMNDQSLANTFASFRSEMTSVVTTMMEVNNQEWAKERKEYEDRRKVEDQQQTKAEERREVQRKADEVKREQERRDDIKRMEKLEERREERRIQDEQKLKEQRVQDQLANQQMMIQMMQNMFQQSNVHPQR